MTDKTSKPVFAIEHETYNALHGFASKRFGAEAAADLVQEACLRFLQMDDRETIKEPRAFLFRIVANLGIDFWRKEKSRGQWQTEHHDLDFDTVKCHRPGPETRMNTEIEVQLLISALTEMPETHRHAFVLNKFEGMTQAAIAKQFGLPEKTVQRQIAAVVAHCAERLGYRND